MGVWQQADHILIPLLDGKSGVAQVIEVPDRPDGAALLAFTRRRRDETEATAPFSLPEIIAIHLCLPPDDQAAHWPVVGFEQIPAIRHIYPLKKHARNGFADLTPQDPAIVEAFANAYHGLYPWDGFPDPAFFASLLLEPDVTPNGIKLKADLQT